MQVQEIVSRHERPQQRPKEYRYQRSSNSFTYHDFSLHVDTLYTDEALHDAPSRRAVRPPTGRQMLRLSSHTRLDASVAWEASEEVDEAKRVVQIAQRVLEAGVPLAHQVMEGVFRRERRLLSSGLVFLVAIGGLAHALHEGLELAELHEERLVRQGPYVLEMVKYLTLLVAGGAPAWLAGVYTLEDAKSAEILEGHLQLLEYLGASDEGSVEACVVLLPYLAHARELAMGRHTGVDGRLDGLFLSATLDSIPHG